MFIFDEDPENYKAFEKAKCLITDTSGISIEFLLLMKRPVLYFDDFDKIHNNQFKNFQNLKTIDDIVKYKFGNFFKENEINNLEKIIEHTIFNFKEKDNEIENFISDNFFNYNKTTNFIKTNLSNIIN